MDDREQRTSSSHPGRLVRLKTAGRIIVVFVAGMASLATSPARRAGGHFSPTPGAVAENSAEGWGDVLVVVEQGDRSVLDARPVMVVDETLGVEIESRNYTVTSSENPGMVSRHVLIRPMRVAGHRYSIRTPVGADPVWTLFDTQTLDASSTGSTPVPMGPVRIVTLPAVSDPNAMPPQCYTSESTVTLSDGRAVWTVPTNSTTRPCVNTAWSWRPAMPPRYPVRYFIPTAQAPWVQNTSPTVIIQTTITQ